MENTYWALFYLSLGGVIVFLCLIVLGFVFRKQLFWGKPYGVMKLLASSTLFLFFVAISVVPFIRCCQDYQYVSGNTYCEEKAKVVTFTYSRKDYDGNGQMINAKPKFFLIDKEEYIVLNAKDVEIGKTYIIRYYPNTKICDVIGEVYQ